MTKEGALDTKRPLVSQGPLPAEDEPRTFKLMKSLLPDFLQERKACGDVFGHFVTFWERIQDAFLSFSSKEEEGYSLSALENLIPSVEDVGFSRFFALYAISHRFI